MLSFLSTATVAILLALSQQTSGMTIPHITKIYDHGGLFADNQCRLKAVLDESRYEEWVTNYGWLQRSCSTGTKFDAKACQCLAVPKIDGGLPTESDLKDRTHKQGTSSSIETVINPAICQLKPAAERTSYLELVHGQGFLTRTCPTGTVFDAQRCDCTLIITETSDGQTAVNSAGDTNHAVEEATEEVPTKEVLEKNEVPSSKILCNKKPVEKSNFYMELIQGYGWMARPCPGGTIFNVAKCQCLIVVAESIDGRSKPVEFTPKVESQVPMITRKKLFEPQLKDKIISGENSTITTITEKMNSIPKPCEMKADTGNRYLELVEGYGWMSRPCPVGTVFDVKICQCSSTPPKSTQPTVPGEKPAPIIATAPCTRKPSHTKTLYLQMVPGGRLVLMKCAEGTVYNVQSCDCTVSTDVRDTSDDNSKHMTKEPITVEPRPEPETEPEVTKADRSGDDKAPAIAVPRLEAKVDREDILENSNEDDKKAPKSVGQTPKPEVNGEDTSDNSNENYKTTPKTMLSKRQHITDGEDTSDSIGGYGMKVITVAPRPHHKNDGQVTVYDNSGNNMNEPTARHQSKSDGKDTIDRDGSKVTDTIISSVKHTQKEKLCDSVVTVLRKIMVAQHGRDHIACFKKLSANPKIYLELSEDLKWVTRECPFDTIFVPQQCRCSVPLNSNDIQDKKKSDEVVDETQQQPKNGDASLFEKMFAQKIFDELNSFPLEESSNLHPSLAKVSPTRSKYVTVPHSNVRIY